MLHHQRHSRSLRRVRGRLCLRITRQMWVFDLVQTRTEAASMGVRIVMRGRRTSTWILVLARTSSEATRRENERAAVVRTEFAKSSWKGERLILSGNTDCYQPLEASYRLTRAMLEVCTEFRNPVGIITKSAVIRCDLDVLKELNSVADLSVAISIPFLDSEMARALEPGAPTPKVRFDTIRALASIGIQVTVAVAPIIPGLNDSQIPGILAAAADAGATAAFRIMLRLPAEVIPVFLERLEQHYPLRASKVISGVRAARGGELYRAEFGSRMSGEGERWAMIERVFDLACKRAGLVSAESESASMPVKHGATFRRPTSQQGPLVRQSRALVPSADSEPRAQNFSSPIGQLTPVPPKPQ